MNTKTPILFLFLFFSLQLNAQNEAHNWIYGDETWLSFNSGQPITIPIDNNIQYSAEYNPICLSDTDGNLMFYSSHGRVFDREHNEMPNGIGFSSGAGFSVTNPIFVIPKPGNDSSYYVLLNSVYNLGSERLIKYFEIDMTLKGGLGDVVTNSFTTLTNNTTDKLTAIRHSNGEDVWIISHGLNSDEYFAWLTTSNGISDVPIVSAIGSDLEFSTTTFRGQIKVSLDGTKMATVNKELDNVDVFDFDRTTGIFSNSYSLEGLRDPQGIEFSPSGRFIYIHEKKSGDFNCRIVQLDTEAGNSVAILASLVEVGNSGTSCFSAGGIQLGPDGKIYITISNRAYLSVINFPDEKGIDCEYKLDAISSPNTRLGLPVFFHEYLQKPRFTYQGVCASSTTSFTIEDFYNRPIDSVFWDFGDPLSGNENFSTSIEPSHDFTGTGMYNVSLTVYSYNKVYTTINIVNIFPTEIDLGDDITICDNIPVYLDMTIPDADYIWSNFSTSPSVAITTPGVHWVNISRDNCPSLTDTIVITHLESPDFELPSVQGICSGDGVELDATTNNNDDSFIWSTGEVTPSITVFDSDEYSVTVSRTNGCETIDTVFVDFSFEFIVNPSQKNVSCGGGSDGIAIVFFIVGGGPFTEYLWSNGATSYRNENLEAGVYTVTITDDLGCSEVEEYTITEPPSIEAEFITGVDDPSTIEGEGQVEVLITGGDGPYQLQIDSFPISNNITFSNLVAGSHNIKITDVNDCSRDFTFVIDYGGEEPSLDFIKVYPSPTDDFLSIQNIRNANSRIAIYNVLGQEIFTELVVQNLTNLEVDVSNWSAGVYLVYIKDNKDEITKTWKIVVE